MILKSSKLKYCHKKIKSLLKENKIDNEYYNFLSSIFHEYKELVKNKQIINEDILDKYLRIKVKFGSKVLFEIK
jgi:hypothetical protein